MLRSWIIRDDQQVLYQQGVVTRMLAPEDLIARYTGGSTDSSRSGRRCSAAPCLCWYRSGPRPNSRWNSKTLYFTARCAIGIACESYPITTEEGGGRWRFRKSTRSFIPST